MNIFMISLLAYTLQTSRERKEAEVRTSLENLTLLLEKSVSISSREIDLSLHTLQAYVEKELREKKQINDQDINLLIQKQEDWISSVARINITDEKGQVKFGNSSIGDGSWNYENYSFFQDAQQQNKEQLFVTKLIRNPNGQGWIHLFARRYNHADGSFAGIISAVLPASYFNNLITELNVGPKGVVLVQDLDMRIIARNPMLKTRNGQVGFVGGPPELSQLVHSGIQSGTIYTRRTTDKVPRIGTFRRLSSMPVFVVVAFAEQDYLAQWYNDVTKAVLLEFIFLSVTTIAAWLLWRQIQASFFANRRCQMLLHNAHDGIHVLDGQGRLLEASESFFRMISHTPEEAIGQTPCYWDACYNKAEIQDLIKNGIRTPEGIRFETFYYNAQGEPYPVEVSSVLVHIDDYEVFFCSARDITEIKKAEENQRIAAAAFDSQVGMLITDPNLKILRSNRAFTEITGYSQQELIGQTPRLLKSGTHDKSFYATMWDHIRNTGSWQGEIWNKRKNGEMYPQYILIASVRDEKGQTTHYVASITDISAYKASEEKIRLLAFYDSLTKLPNRRLFLDHLEKSMREAEHKKQLGIVLCIDLDNFKALNDTEGHETGDRLLQQVAARLLDCAGANHMIARLGSDEFVLLLDQSASETEAIQHAEMTAKCILQALSQPYFFEKSEYRSSASIGISLFGLQAHENVQDPIKRADIAMSEAKNYGRNTYRFFDPLIQSQVQERAEIDAGLRQALEKNQLVLYYQPQVNHVQQMTGVEALLRWQHPTKGLILPARFIPVAEENGFIIPLGKWVLESACQQLSKWAKHSKTAQLSMAVNVSASQFGRDEFVQDVIEILERTQAPAHLLKLELTESALVMRVEDIVEKMMVLKRYGVMFSLDDFGTGYSSLTYLKRIPIDQLKIDQSFVRDILVNSSDAEIAKIIIALTKTFGISVLAEGVETDAQRDVLEQYGCYDYQGYLFGKPMPIDELEQYLLLQKNQN
ncbi:bifunctional diguanylate cyclase/phosphodiesterase [Acinetobacter sp. ANC 4633]|uniref:bifunctional diguanylate cyclase/phosphodiesterase n=1 Tax=Acinetobacter sp. ANC 4633 TaxID=2529845 RepID=UPI001D182E02|nr:EAL domain-containing protein [Acinetobacter sp. ANC 4633]